MNAQLKTRKELVEYIKQIMPDGLNEYEQIAFIEMQIAKQIAFDEKYLWGDKGTQEKIYQKARERAQQTKSTNPIKRKLICVTMAELFGYVVKQFGFDVKYQKRNNSEIKSGEDEIFNTLSETKKDHVCTVIGLPNGKFIEADIQGDLARLQTRSKPKFFGARRHGTKIENGVVIDIIDDSICDQTFRKIYGLQENERFTDEYIMVRAAELRVQKKSPIEMFEIFLEDEKIRKELKNTRCVEANKLYKAILAVSYDSSVGEKCFFKGENKAIIDECILTDNNNNRRYSFCVYAEENEKKILYVYSKKTKRMVTLGPDEIQKMSQGTINVELGVCNTELKNKMITFVKNNMHLIDDIFIDEEEL